jgi:tetratricopeptide (TPR) repeat protein
MSWGNRNYLAHLFKGLAGLLAFTPVFALAKTPSELFLAVSPSVVVVVAKDASGEPQMFGSGVVIAPGQVITNCHVVKDGVSLEVQQGGQSLSAVLTHADPDRDLCQLASPGLTAPPVNKGTVEELKVGVRVYAVGAPRGLDLTLSDGLVSGLREIGGGIVIQTTAPISPGSSGGGLFDEEGRLVGITTFFLTESQGLNFAMPVDWIATLPRLEKEAKLDLTAGDNWLLKASELEDKEDWRGLLNHAKTWVKRQPKSTIAWAILGEAHKGLGQYQQALKSFSESLRLDPQYAAAWNNLGITYASLRQYDQAIPAYREALRLHAKQLATGTIHAAAMYNLGAAYYDLRQYNQAISAFRQSLRLDPKLALAWNYLVNAYHHLRQYDQAIWALRESLRVDPQDAAAWNNLGNAYGSLRKHDQAIPAYRESLRLDPLNSKAWNNLGNAYGGLRQYNKAIAAYHEALRLDPQDANAWKLLGFAYALIGDRAKVMEAYQTLRQLNPIMADELFNNAVAP